MPFLHLEVSVDGPVATITLNRPQTLNALDADLLRELKAAVDSLDDLRVVIVTGRDRSFAAGADIAAMKNMSPQEAMAFTMLGHQALNAVEQARPVTIAAVNGFALGGGLELGLACDIRIAADSAKLGMPEVTIGLIPGWGGTQRLARLVGSSVAKELILSGRRVSAEEARSFGLVNRVVPATELVATCADLARRIASNSPLAVSLAKQTIDRGQQLSLAEGIEEEIRAYSTVFATEDRLEGLTAFLEKRPPNFRGR